MASSKEPKAPGINRKMLENALEGYKRPRVDTKDPQAIAERIDEYLHFCMEKDVAPGIAACASWLGVNYHTLLAWHTGERGTPEHQRVISRFYGIVQNVWEQDMHEGTINNISGIFVGKSFFGLKDTQEIVVQHTTQDQLPVADLIAESKLLAESGTIEADYKEIEDDPQYERAVERAKQAEERKAKRAEEKPIKDIINKAKRKQYLKGYYQTHRAEMDAARVRNRKLAEERAQNGTPAPTAEGKRRGRPPKH